MKTLSITSKISILAFLLSGFTVLNFSAAKGSDPDIAAIVRQFHINYSKGDVEKNGSLVDENIIVHLNGGADNKINGATFTGRQQFVDWLKQDKVFFPDGKITDHEIIVSGNKAAIRFTLNATHKGAIPTPNGPIPPSGKKVVIQATEFFTFNKQGKLIELETLVNDMGLIGQVTSK